jgi:hypothetical protein
VASSACLSSSLAFAVALGLGAAPLAAQSSHLTRLGMSAPAVAPDPVSANGIGGWGSAWVVPAAGSEARGVLVAVEHSAFAAVTTAFLAVRARVGVLWQFGLAQTSVSDLFDDVLLGEFPGLATLRAAATQVSVDAIVPLSHGAAAGLGGRYERDEFLGDAAGIGIVRASAAGPTILGVRSAFAYERVVTGGRGPTDAGRIRLGLARTAGGGRLATTLAVGATLGELWEQESPQRHVAGALRVTLLEVLSLTGSLGAERDAFGAGGWLGFWAFGLGLALGPVGADFRRGGSGAAEAAATGVSLRYQPH